MAEQKAAARAAWKGSGEKASDDIWFDIAEEYGSTEFTGYLSEQGEGQLLAIVREGKRVESAGAGDDVMLVTNQTPFYAESGGQMGDAGTITGDAGVVVDIADTAKPLGRIHAHRATIRSGIVKPGDALHLAVDGDRRARTRANHSATHLLHAALRHRLGGHVTQKGSMVSADRLRFDSPIRSRSRPPISPPSRRK